MGSICWSTVGPIVGPTSPGPVGPTLAGPTCGVTCPRIGQADLDRRRGRSDGRENVSDVGRCGPIWVQVSYYTDCMLLTVSFRLVFWPNRSRLPRQAQLNRLSRIHQRHLGQSRLTAAISVVGVFMERQKQLYFFLVYQAPSSVISIHY